MYPPLVGPHQGLTPTVQTIVFRFYQYLKFIKATEIDPKNKQRTSKHTLRSNAQRTLIRQRRSEDLQHLSELFISTHAWKAPETNEKQKGATTDSNKFLTDQPELSQQLINNKVPALFNQLTFVLPASFPFAAAYCVVTHPHQFRLHTSEVTGAHLKKTASSPG